MTSTKKTKMCRCDVYNMTAAEDHHQDEEDPTKLLVQIMEHCEWSSRDGNDNMWHNAIPVDYLKTALIGTNGSRRNARVILAAHGTHDTLLHSICSSPNVTIEIVKWIVELYPEAVKHQSSPFGWLPLHRACYNETISFDVIKYLVDIYPDSLLIPCWQHQRLPLHCYLERRIRNVVSPLCHGTLAYLIQQCPESLEAQTDNGSTALHIILCDSTRSLRLDLVHFVVSHNRNALSIRGGYHNLLPLQTLLQANQEEEGCSADVIRYLVEAFPAALRIHPLPLHVACRNGKNGRLEIIKLLTEAYPEAVFTLSGSEVAPLAGGMLPIHELCMNSWSTPEAIQYLSDRLFGKIVSTGRPSTRYSLAE